MVGSLQLLNPAGKGSPPLSVKTTSPGSLSYLLYASRLTVWEITKTCKCAALVSKSEPCGRPKVGTFHKPRRVQQHWVGVPSPHEIPHLPVVFKYRNIFFSPSGLIMDINKEIRKWILKTFDAVMCFKDFTRYRITSLYRAHITNFDCLFVGYCSKARAQWLIEKYQRNTGLLNLDLSGFG